ncbi:MAG: hypothetical protein ABSE66_07215 [Thermoplasmata archaeon]
MPIPARPLALLAVVHRPRAPLIKVAAACGRRSLASLADYGRGAVPVRTSGKGWVTDSIDICHPAS